MEDRGGKGLLFLQSVVTLAHSPRPCFIFPVSVHVDDVCTTGSCRNVLIKRWRKGKRTTEGYNWHWKIFIHELLCIKKRTSERRERVSFFYAWQQVNKNRSSIFHGVIFLFHTYWNFFLTESRTLVALLCEVLSFMFTIGRTMYFQSFAQYVWNNNVPCTVTKVPVTLQKCPFVSQKCLKKETKVSFPLALSPPSWLLFKSGKKRLASKAQVLILYAAVLRLMTSKIIVTFFCSEQEKILIRALTFK